MRSKLLSSSPETPELEINAEARRRGGELIKSLLSPSLSSFLRQEETGLASQTLAAHPVLFEQSSARIGRPSPFSYVPLGLLLLALCAGRGKLRAETNGAAMFLGEASCSSSSCHGGAGEKKDQCFIWANKDFHSKSYATLTMARSVRIAENAKVSDPTRDARCTVCHAPFLTVPAAELGKGIDPTLGVSCESCHGRAENWIRSHTRPDYTHADRVHAGMRDLENLYVRANGCVACHQNVDANLLQAGHPELIFELDGQLVTEPRHWREKSGWSGPQTWLVGQAVALREMSWYVARQDEVKTKILEDRGLTKINDRWEALLWLIQAVGTVNGVLPSDGGLTPEPTPMNAERAQKWADDVARAASAAQWTDEMTRRCLAKLGGAAADFRQKKVARAEQGRRAERLVLALDRLVMGLKDAAAAKRLDEPLNRLFKDAQSLPDFDPEQFAGDLEKLREAIEGK